MFKHTLAAAALVLSVAGSAFAFQDDRIVVTGSRVMNPNLEIGRQSNVPHVHVVRRADNYLVRLEVLSDTRERAPRRVEVRETLTRILSAAASNPDITIAMMGDTLIDLDADMTEQIDIREHRSREDVSTATLYLKTSVRETDNFDDPDQRIAGFLEGLSTMGRAEVIPSGSYNLTITGGADQYRNDVVRAIAADARFLRSTFGTDYAIEVETDLHERVQLVQTGTLDLAIYLPYTTSIYLRDE